MLGILFLAALAVSQPASQPPAAAAAAAAASGVV
jgi:hypothetical protein